MSVLAQVPIAVADTIQTAAAALTGSTAPDSGTTTLSEMISAQPVEAPELSIWELCVEGGWIMIPLAVLAVISIYIFFERSIATYKASRLDDTFMKRIKDYIHEGEIESALNLCKSTSSPYARLIAKGISRIGRPTE